MIPATKLRAAAGITAAIAICAFSAQAMAKPQQTRITASITPSYFSGNYGTNSRTDIFYLPFELKADTGNLSLQATIPYIRVKSQNAVIAGGAVVGNAGGQPRTRGGLGDIWLGASYRFRLDHDDVFTPYVKVKFGTASRSQGLGTGANDVEFGAKYRTRVAHDYYPFARLGYRIHGHAAGLVLRDYFTYSVGLSYASDLDDIVTLLYAGHQSSQPGLAPASELVGGWNHRVQDNFNVQLFALLGLSNGSPDYGGGLGLKYRF